MDEILETAIRRRDAAKREFEKWDAFISSYEEVRGDLRVSPEGGNAELSTIVRAPFVGGKLNQTAHMAAEIIREAGRPVPTRALLEEMRKRGLEVGGANPTATLSARLSRSPSIENDRIYGWRLVESRQTEEAVDRAPYPGQSTASTRSDHNQRREGGAGGGI